MESIRILLIYLMLIIIYLGISLFLNPLEYIIFASITYILVIWIIILALKETMFKSNKIFFKRAGAINIIILGICILLFKRTIDHKNLEVFKENKQNVSFYRVIKEQNIKVTDIFIKSIRGRMK